MTDEAQAAPAAPEAVAPVADAPAVVADAPAAPEAPKPSQNTREALSRAFDKAFEGSDDGQARGPDGRFVSAAPKEPTTEGAPETPKAEASKPVEAPKPPLSEAPARFSPDAKQAWAQTPQPVQGEIRRAITEMERGLAEKDAALEPLKPWLAEATRHGVKLDEVIGNYVRMENTLRQDPRAGLEALARHVGMTLDQFLGFAKPDGKAPAAPDPRDQQIAALTAQVQQLTSGFQRQQQDGIMAQVQQFAATHPRMDELSDDIARMLETGYAPDLATAYDLADRLKPAPALAQVAPPAPPPQPRPQRSVIGAPTGSNPAAAPSRTTSEAVSRALAATGF